MIYRFHIPLIKILAEFFVGINKLILKFLGKDKGTRIAKINLNKKDKVRGLVLISRTTKSYTNQRQCSIGGERHISQQPESRAQK